MILHSEEGKSRGESLAGSMQEDSPEKDVAVLQGLEELRDRKAVSRQWIPDCIPDARKVCIFRLGEGVLLREFGRGDLRLRQCESKGEFASF